MNDFKKYLLVTTGFVVAIVVIYIAMAPTRNKVPTWEQRDAKINALKAEMEEFSKAAKAALGDNSCKTDGDCRVIGIGAMTCGLHPNYLVYSMKGTDETKLKNAVTEFNIRAEKVNDLLLNVPNCGVRHLPIRCVKGFCKAMER